MTPNPTSETSPHGLAPRRPQATIGSRLRALAPGLATVLLLLLAGTMTVAAQDRSGDLEHVRTLISEKKLAAAETALNQILDSAPDEVDALALRARVYRETDRLDRAAADYKRVTELRPDDTDAWFWLGTIDRWQSRDSAALFDFGKVLELAPCHGGALRGRARVEIHTGVLTAAEKDLRAALKCRADDQEAADLLTDVLVRSGRQGEARELVGGSFTGAAREERLAKLDMDAGDPARAVDRLQAAIAETGPTAELERRLGAAEYQRGRMAAALAAYRRAAELDPKDHGSLYWIGVIAYRQGDDEESLKAWNTLLEDNPDSPGALVGKARILRARGERTEAMRLVERALAAEPDNSEALIMRASILLEEGQSEQARTDYRQVLTESSTNTDAQIGIDRLGARNSWDSEATYSSSKVIEGLEDAGLVSNGVVIRPTRIQYLTEGGSTGFHSRLRDGLDLAATVSAYREAVINLDANAPVYDFDVWSVDTGLDHQLSPFWRVSWRVGGTRYKPRDEGSVPRENRSRGLLAAVYDDGRDRFELSYQRSPFIQRGFAGDFQFRIFDRDHFAADWDHILTAAWSLHVSSGVSFFNDGDTPVFGNLAVRWHRGRTELVFGARHAPFPARFLGVNQHLDFVDYDEVYATTRTVLGAGFSLTGEGRYGRFGTTVPQAAVGGEIVSLAPDHNKRRLFRGDLRWSPQQWDHLRLGVVYFTDHFSFDTGPYNTLNVREWDLYAELANERPERVRYAIRYLRQLIHDERDPSYTGDVYSALCELRLDGDQYRDRSLWLGFEGRYGRNDLEETREYYRVYLRVPF